MLSKEKQLEFLEAAKPLIEWLNNNMPPQASAIVEIDGAALLETIHYHPTQEFIKD